MPGKIALALGDDADNYGTVLQAFATYRKISDLGYDAEAIDFTRLKKSIRNRKLRYFAGKILDASIVREKAVTAFTNNSQTQATGTDFHVGENFSLISAGR